MRVDTKRGENEEQGVESIAEQRPLTEERQELPTRDERGEGGTE
jgi:hypothetical protein